MIFFLVASFSLVYLNSFTTFPYLAISNGFEDDVIDVTIAAHIFSVLTFVAGALTFWVPRHKVVWIFVFLISLVTFTLNLSKTIMIHANNNDIVGLYKSTLFRIDISTIFVSVLCMLITILAYHRTAVSLETREESEHLVDKDTATQV